MTEPAPAIDIVDGKPDFDTAYTRCPTGRYTWDQLVKAKRAQSLRREPASDDVRTDDTFPKGPLPTSLEWDVKRRAEGRAGR